MLEKYNNPGQISMVQYQQKGFTLLELVVAIAIFAVLSVLSYSGLRSMLDTRARLRIEARHLSELQSAMALMGRDFQQLAKRDVRVQFHTTKPYLSWQPALEGRVEITRNGWRNPGGRVRSSLQRVAWELEEENLYRLSWPILDRTDDEDPYRTKILSGIESFNIELFHNKWHEQWPPTENTSSQPGLQSQASQTPPKAVRITIDYLDWGKIQRIYIL
jgi:general secretion pathway protein J